jgi:hypothetical protein
MRPLSGILSTQLVLCIGRRMTNAYHRIHQSELSALKLLQLITSPPFNTRPEWQRNLEHEEVTACEPFSPR